MKRCPSRCVAAAFLLAWLAGAATTAAAPPDALPEPSFELRIRLRDTDTGVPLPARVSVNDARWAFYHPIPGLNCGFHHPASGRGFFYADGEATLRVPAGWISISASHGFEYRTALDTLSIRADTEVTLLLQRMVDMPALGWRSGDTHVHMTHTGLDVMTLDPPGLFLMQRAEDIHVLNALENGPGFTGDVDPLSTPDHRLFFGIEFRSAFWGHLGILGTSATTPYFCCSRGQPAFPMNLDVTAQARALGGMAIQAHPFSMDPADLETVDHGWPSVGFGRELPIDAALGAVDAIDVYSYSNRALADYDLWYGLLNYGFRVPATAGTDACANSRLAPPPGGYRVYARLGPGSWTYFDWLDAIRQGRSFITNGPLVRRFTVAGQWMGGIVTLAPEETRRVTCFIDVSSQWPLNEAEIVVNGEVRGVVRASTSSCRVSGAVTVDLGGRSGWVAARGRVRRSSGVTVGNELVFHTNPVYVDVPDAPPRYDGAEPTYYLGWVERVWRLAASRGYASPEDGALVDSRMKAAINVIADRLTAPGWRGQPETPRPEDGADRNLNDPAAARVGIAASAPPGSLTFRVADTPAPERVDLFDVTGRRIDSRRLGPGATAGGTWTWQPRDPGARPPAGIYFARFTGPGWTRTARAILVR